MSTIRVAILSRYIAACAAYIAEAANCPYYDSQTQADYLKDHAERIDRASRHLPGFYSTDEKAMADMVACAEREKSRQPA